jgi:prevent-host-death family protein
MRTMAAGEFKAKCLGVMTEVNSTGQPVLVTKRGKPFARVLP